MNNNHLEHYIKAINKIDDHFEYANESLKDRAFIQKVLAELTESLSKAGKQPTVEVSSKVYKIKYAPDNKWCGNLDCCSPVDGYIIYEQKGLVLVEVDMVSCADDVEQAILELNNIIVEWVE